MKTGKAMPVEPDYLLILPDPKGPHLAITDAGETVRGHRVKGEGDEPAPLAAVRARTSHFATCTEPERFRRS